MNLINHIWPAIVHNVIRLYVDGKSVEDIVTFINFEMKGAIDAEEVNEIIDDYVILYT